VIGLGLAAWAALPDVLAYQGVLRNDQGERFAAGQKLVTFRLYDVANEGTALWEREMAVSLDEDGLFNVALPGGSELRNVLRTAENAGKSIYIGLTVKNSAGEIRPRQKLSLTSMVALALDATEAKGNFTVSGAAAFLGDLGMTGTNTVCTVPSVDAQGGILANGTATFESSATVGGNLTVTSGGFTVNGAQAGLPIGAIVMWSGDALPSDDWRMCSANQVVTNTLSTGETKIIRIPDLRDLFVVGAGQRPTDRAPQYIPHTCNISNETVTLTTEQMPSHAHQWYGDDSVNIGVNKKVTNDVAGFDQSSYGHGSGSDSPGRNYEMKAVGGGQAHTNLPPYYALYYIIKVK